MSFTLSGNCGVAGATVNLTGAATSSTTADGSGNFAFSGLLAGTYFIAPTDSGLHFFIPNSMKRVLTGNVTLCNFGAVVPAFPYLQLAYDSFQQANGPLNGTNWTQVTGEDALSVLNNACVNQNGSDSGACWTNAVWTNRGQYCQIQLLAIDAASTGLILLYSSLDESIGYALEIELNGPSIMLSAANTVGTILFMHTIVQAFQPGDLIRLDKAGTVLKLYYNNVFIVAATDSPGTVSGNPGIDIDSDAAAGLEIVDFVAGAIAGPAPSSNQRMGFDFKF
jgi:hypothetical protein